MADDINGPQGTEAYLTQQFSALTRKHPSEVPTSPLPSPTRGWIAGESYCHNGSFNTRSHDLNTAALPCSRHPESSPGRDAVIESFTTASCFLKRPAGTTRWVQQPESHRHSNRRAGSACSDYGLCKLADWKPPLFWRSSASPPSNLGHAADTAGAVHGELAGPCDCFAAIPGRWLQAVRHNDLLQRGV